MLIDTDNCVELFLQTTNFNPELFYMEGEHTICGKSCIQGYLGYIRETILVIDDNGELLIVFRQEHLKLVFGEGYAETKTINNGVLREQDFCAVGEEQ